MATQKASWHSAYWNLDFLGQHCNSYTHAHMHNLCFLQIGIQTDSVLSARLQIIRIYIREDGRLVIEFKTHAKFRGNQDFEFWKRTDTLKLNLPWQGGLAFCLGTCDLAPVPRCVQRLIVGLSGGGECTLHRLRGTLFIILPSRYIAISISVHAPF